VAYATPSMAFIASIAVRKTRMIHEIANVNIKNSHLINFMFLWFADRASRFISCK